MLPYPNHSDSARKAQLPKQLHPLPKTNQNSLLLSKDYNVQEIDNDFWVPTVPESLPASVKYGEQNIFSTQLAELHLQKPTREDPIQLLNRHSSQFNIFQVKPLKFNNIDVEDQHILN